MKEICLVLLFVYSGFQMAPCQTVHLLGMTSSGGEGGGGTVFSAAPDGSGLTVLWDFDALGASPSGPLIEGTDRRFYGMTFSSGLFNAGLIYGINADGTGFEKLYDFNFAEGSRPRGSLVLGSDGMFYGTTSSGGSAFAGVIFRINQDGSGFEKLHDFDQTNGRFPWGSLFQGSDGKLYGMTSLGGLLGHGVIFGINTDGTGFEKLHDFDDTNGRDPRSALVEGNDGLLYGTTWRGGASNHGVIFRIGADGAGFEKLHDFDGTNGQSPWGSLILGSDGKFYGMATYGGSSFDGAIFRINGDGTGFEKLHDFNGADGSSPFGAPVQGNDGMLYGMTQEGGSLGYGVIFRVATDGTGF